MKCFATLCDETPYCKCTCGEEELILCNYHRFQHMAAEGNHILDDIPGNQILKSKQIELCPSSIDSEYLVSEFNNKLVILNIETTNCTLPKTLLNCLDSMDEIFLQKIFELERNFSKDAPKICEDFIFYVSKVLPSLSVNCAAFTSVIVNHLTKMYAECSAIYAPLIEKLVSKLKKELNMPETRKKNLFYTVELKAAEQEFYYEILLLEEFTAKKAYSIFISKFQGFYNESIDIKAHFNNLEKEYRRKQLEIHEISKAEIITYSKSIYLNVTYNEVLVNLHENDLDCWEEFLSIQIQYKKIFQKIFHAGNFKINQILEISSELFITIVEINSKKTYVIKVNKEVSCVVIRLDSDSAVIASGSVKECIVIFQNSPRKYLTFRLRKNKFIENSLIHLEIDSNCTISSAVFIESSGLIICSTAEGIIFSTDHACRDRLLVLTDSDKCIIIKYHIHTRLVSLVTSSQLILLTSSLRLLYKFRLYGRPVELILKNDQAILYNTCNSLTNYNILRLSDCDFSCLSKNSNQLGVSLGQKAVRFIKTLKRQKIYNMYEKELKKVKVGMNISPEYNRLITARGESEELYKKIAFPENNPCIIQILKNPADLNYEKSV